MFLHFLNMYSNYDSGREEMLTFVCVCVCVSVCLFVVVIHLSATTAGLPHALQRPKSPHVFFH